MKASDAALAINERAKIERWIVHRRKIPRFDG
jgi:hypothetical protein